MKNEYFKFGYAFEPSLRALNLKSNLKLNKLEDRVEIINTRDFQICKEIIDNKKIKKTYF